ncbi:hypothetical protein J4G37_56855, partial [Microvirga sp. 3-52]|nr:hypothetical protein [Microvirga sp. 3-52]
EGTIRKLPMTYAEWKERGATPKPKSTVEERLRLETELQAVLGQLSLLKPGDKEYAELDEAFLDLSKRLKRLL